MGCDRGSMGLCAETGPSCPLPTGWAYSPLHPLLLLAPTCNYPQWLPDAKCPHPWKFRYPPGPKANDWPPGGTVYLTLHSRALHRIGELRLGLQPIYNPIWFFSLLWPCYNRTKKKHHFWEPPTPSYQVMCSWDIIISTLPVIYLPVTFPERPYPRKKLLFSGWTYYLNSGSPGCDEVYLEESMWKGVREPRGHLQSDLGGWVIAVKMWAMGEDVFSGKMLANWEDRGRVTREAG